VEAIMDSFSMTLPVDRSPDEVFAAIGRVREWWDGQISGRADGLGEEFEYRHGDAHFSRQRVSEWVPGRRVVWRVVDAHLSFVEDHREWVDTEIVFDLRPAGAGTELTFTHRGLTAACACFEACAPAWSHYVGQRLVQHLATYTTERSSRAPGGVCHG
jgi:hypothetical protein